MRHLLAFVLMIALVGSAAAVDLGNVSKEVKNDNFYGENTGTPDGRQGGEYATPFVIAGVPFTDSGSTLGMADDYDIACPYTGSMAGDAWYSWTAAVDGFFDIDLCGSAYDTKLFVLADGAEYACNDDFYFDEVCGTYVSKIEAMAVSAGVTYMIAVDGYGSNEGDYLIEIVEFEVEPPCIITCDGLWEGEPELMNGYEDAYNGGCNSPEFGNPFLDLTEAADSNGELVFCGISGWFNDNTTRDTDWMYVAFGELGIIEWTLDAEYPVYGFELIGECPDVTVGLQITAGACLPATMTLQGNPGDVIMLWVGPTEYGGPAGFVGHEFNYVMNVTGLFPGTTATDNVSFDGIKSLYR